MHPPHGDYSLPQIHYRYRSHFGSSAIQLNPSHLTLQNPLSAMATSTGKWMSKVEFVHMLVSEFNFAVAHAEFVWRAMGSSHPDRFKKYDDQGVFRVFVDRRVVPQIEMSGPLFEHTR